MQISKGAGGQLVHEGIFVVNVCVCARVQCVTGPAWPRLEGCMTSNASGDVILTANGHYLPINNDVAPMLSVLMMLSCAAAEQSAILHA